MMILATMLISFVALFWAANHLVTGAVGVAHHYRVSPLIIGLTLVAITTSTPEMMVGIASGLDGRIDLALGNAIGSNIANIGLILGITILIRPLTTRSSLWRREYPLLFLIMLFMYSLMMDGYLSILDGCLLLLVCLILIAYLLFLAHRSSNDVYAREFNQMINIKRPMKANWLSLLFGLLVLPFSAHFFVDSAVQLASWLGISELKIGLTIVAIGTSLPQVATSLVAAFKGQDDIAVGNILGSNMFILLLVMAFPSIIHPSTINRSILWRDIPIMFVITLILLFINHQNKKTMTRWHGGLLLLIYCCYIIALVVNVI